MFEEHFIIWDAYFLLKNECFDKTTPVYVQENLVPSSGLLQISSGPDKDIQTAAYER